MGDKQIRNKILVEIAIGSTIEIILKAFKMLIRERKKEKEKKTLFHFKQQLIHVHFSIENLYNSEHIISHLEPHNFSLPIFHSFPFYISLSIPMKRVFTHEKKLRHQKLEKLNPLCDLSLERDVKKNHKSTKLL